MSTKQTTTSSQQQTATQSGSSQGGFQNIFDPASMSRYQAATGQALGGLQSWASNPLQNAFFNTLAQMQRGNLGQQGQSNMQAFLQNLRTSGLSGSSPFAMAQTAQMGRFNSGQQAQGFNALLAQMPQYQLQALGALQGGFNPLQTGVTQQQSYTGTQRGQQTGQQTQQMSGLGTWLPQLAGGALGGLSSLLSGGASGFGKLTPASGGLSGNMPSGWGTGDVGNMPNVFSGPMPNWMGGPSGVGPQLPNAFMPGVG